ncbi:MAG: antibiotic biosynthesis monooxygenase [Pseudomonadota bacterium]
MIAVIFEVEPAHGQLARYLDMAAKLALQLNEIDGFLSIERFESLSAPGKILSLSFWRDEQAVMAWRQLESHRTAQRQGRDEVFDGYRLRVAHVVRDYGMDERNEAPSDSRAAHEGHQP